MKTEKRNQPQERKDRKGLYEKYGYLIGSSTADIPEKHRCVNGGLRCFKKVLPRDPNGNIIPNSEKNRCGRACSKGSLYCSSHGGSNNRALVHGARSSSTLEVYKGVHKAELQDLMETFLNDPKILDQKAELVMVRTVLHNYIMKVREGETKPSNPGRKLKIIQEILENEEMNAVDKLLTIKQITDSIRALDDGQVIDRITRCTEAVGKTIERIHRLETKDQFMLTPEGLKIILRGVLDILKDKVHDPVALIEIRKALLSISTKTNGDLSKYNETIDVTPHNE